MREILEKQKKKHKRKKLKTILLIILIIIIAIVGFIAYRTQKNGGGMRGFLATMLGHNEHTLENLDELFVLIVGESNGMTDTIMVCSYDPKTQEASMLSIPRDTFIGTNKTAATASDKINSIYNSQGMEALVEKVEKLTNIEIPYYVKVDTAGLKSLVDTIGGVNFEVPINMDYDDNKQNLHIHLQKGNQLLDGDKAEQVVRFRHNNDGTSYPVEYGDNDYGRMKTQREFLKAVLHQTIKLGNIIKIGEFIDIGTKYVNTNINVKFIKDYVPYVLDFKISDLKTATLPGASEKCNGVWIFLNNKEETEKIIDEMFLSIKDKDDDKDDTTENKIVETDIKVNEIEDDKQAKSNGIKVEILNGASTKNQLTRMEKELKKAGYTVTNTKTTNETEKTVIINRKNLSDEKLEKLKDTIGTGYFSNQADKKSKADVTIIIGNDF